MYQFIIVVLLTSLSFYASANKMIKDYPAEQISDHVYVIHGPKASPNVANKGFMNNPAFIVNGQGVVVIDPGSSLYVGEMVLRQIKKITNLPVTHIFNTHIHGDHWLGNQAFTNKWKGIVIYALPEMIKKAKEGEAQSWIDLMSTLTEGQTNGTVAVLPNKATMDEELLEINGLHYKMLAPKNAHSKTDVMIEVVEESVVFLGDNVTYHRVGRMDDATFKGNINACNVALEVDAKKYVPGHGPTGGKEVVESFKHLIKTVYDLTAKYYDEDMEDFEMKPLIRKQLPEYESWPGFNDEIGKFISLAILEIEADF